MSRSATPEPDDATVTTVGTLGECMIELTHADRRSLQLGYAGEVFDTCVYLARIARPDVRVAFGTAVGDDPSTRRILHRP